MTDCAENKNPLVRNGTSQRLRILEKLSPASVEIIDKSAEDWMVWAGRLSDHLHFISLNNDIAGTMKPFFMDNISARMAVAASYQPEQLSQFIREILRYIETEDSELKVAYTTLYDIIFSYFLWVDRLFQSTKSDREYNDLLKNHIQAKLLLLEPRAFAYYQASLIGTPVQRLIVDSQEIDLKIFYEPVYGHLKALAQGLSSLTGLRYPDSSDFTTYYGSIPADPSIFGGQTGFIKKIRYVTQHNFFTSILDEINASATFITKLSMKYLGKYLTDWPYHSPNYTLYLVWLQLLNDTRDHLNGLTRRHLDFYYQGVLRLKRLAQSPDKSFLSLELNKITQSYALKNETIFLGPKDDIGDIITYQSIKETVLNKAVIKHLSSVYFGGAEDNIGTQINEGRLFAAPIANSADGLGEKLEGDVISWHPFHIKEYAHGELTGINMPQATVGFAVASHYLRLKEGYRVITLEIIPSTYRNFDEFSYRAFVTTEKEWLEIEATNLLLTKSGGSVTKLTFTCDIPADLDPVVGYDKAVHLGSMETSEPVLKILLEHKDLETFLYEELSSLNLSSLKLTVKVGDIGSYSENGLKSLELHNDDSSLNPSKPFHPWGPEPTIGNSLIIGSDELFYKPGAEIQLNFYWKDYPLDESGNINQGAIDFDYYTGGATPAVEFNSFNSVAGPNTPNIDLLKLDKNAWSILESDKSVFTQSSSNATEKVSMEVDLSGNNHEQLFLKKDQPWKSYNSDSKNGFIKIKLRNDFGHRDYYNALQSYLKLDNDDHSAPFYPYQPTLQSFTISYRSSCSLSMNTNDLNIYHKRPLEFFNVGPFGDNEQHRVLQNSPPKLMSRLISTSSGSLKSQGSLFLGLENLQPGDTQSILFQVQEGSEDPLLEKPEDHLVWEYLTANGVWKEFDDTEVGDSTKGLIESGIIDFIIPGDASTVQTSFESNLIWIRCSVKEAPDAVCRIMGIYPNTVEVHRTIPEGKEYQSIVMPAGSIKKLLFPDASIKKIEQPYTSFDGRPKEGDEFYLRASERLRHKDRAITIWDYERLVLEDFPEIYKVKCLNHTEIGGSISEGNLVYNEIAPGHVSVITIPNLANRNDIDPLKPYTRKSTLQNIEEFLKNRSSCQVRIHTAQPDFEEVKVKCTIFLRDEYPDINYYRGVIQQDITNFLSPWAFSSDQDLNFGGRVHKSVLIDFIEELPYVDYLTNFELFHIKSSGEINLVDEAVASTARSILVSVPAIQHDLLVMLQSGEVPQQVACNDE